MRSKLNFLIGVSLARKVKTKWFVAAQIILCLLIVGIFNLDIIIKSFGGDFDETVNIYVVDDTNVSYDVFKEALLLNEKNLYGEDSHLYEIEPIAKVEDKKELVGEEGGIIVHIQESLENAIEVELISQETVDTYDYSLISSALNSVKVVLVMDDLGLTAEDYSKIMSDVVITTSLVDENNKTEAEGTEMIMTTVFPIFILPIFILSLFLVQMIGAEVNDEKTTKAMEIIISNVSPKTHFFAKVIAGNLFVIGQAVLACGYGGLAIFIRNLASKGGGAGAAFFDEIGPMVSSFLESSVGDKLVIILPLAIVLILLTFVAYALLAGVLASMTATTEDYQQVQVPIIIISLLGYYLGIMAGMFKGSLVIKVFSFIPFISAILAPSLLVLGQIGIFELVIAIIIMIITDFLLIKYGLRVYKVGILNYSSSGLWKKMANALKNNSIR